jgi:hypothetical protein
MVANREWQRFGLTLGVEANILYIVVQKLEIFGPFLQVILAPLNHAFVQVNANILLWLCVLLHQLTGDTSAAATKIKDGVLFIGGNHGENQPTRWIIEKFGGQWAQPVGAFQREVMARIQSFFTLFASAS